MPTIVLDGYTIPDLLSDNGLQVQALFECAADYAELYTGLPVGIADAQSFYVQIPENKRRLT